MSEVIGTTYVIQVRFAGIEPVDYSCDWRDTALDYTDEAKARAKLATLPPEKDERLNAMKEWRLTRTTREVVS